MSSDNGRMVDLFTNIQPTTCGADSPEPSLLKIIRHYYVSHGVSPKVATMLTFEYIEEWSQEWARLEKTHE